jgi:hypothetical protein
MAFWWSVRDFGSIWVCDYVSSNLFKLSNNCINNLSDSQSSFKVKVLIFFPMLFSLIIPLCSKGAMTRATLECDSPVASAMPER